MTTKTDYHPPGWTGDDVRLYSKLGEAKHHLDALEAILTRLGCDELEKEFEAIRESMEECWKGR